MKVKVLLFLLLVLVGACVRPDDGVNEERPLINLQITEDEDLGALGRFMTELEGRNIKVTLIVDDFVATQGCDQLQGYDAAGHEIMVYGRAEEVAGETVELTTLSPEEQKAVIGGAKSAIEECLGHPVKGFRSYHFIHNEETWQILDELGIEYNLSFVAHSSNSMDGHRDDVWPYPVAGHDFWAVPMHSLQTEGGTKAFCDRPFRLLEADEWEALMKSELTRMDENGEPLKVEFHPWFSANDEGRWEAFVSLLDFIGAQDGECVTVEEMIARMPVAE